MSFELRIYPNQDAQHPGISGEPEILKCDIPMNGQEVLPLSKTAGAAKGRVMAWRVNHILRPLGWCVDDDAEIEFVDTTSFAGAEIYRRSLVFLLVIACRKVLGSDVFIRHSINDSYYCELVDREITPEEVEAVFAKMCEFVALGVPIHREVLPTDKLRRIFIRQGDPEKADFLQWTGRDPVVVYRSAGMYGYFGGTMAADFGMIPTFNLVPFKPGLLMQYPSITHPTQLSPLQIPQKITGVFREYSMWLDVLGVGTMASVHERVCNGKALDLILISEAFHSEALGQIAREIHSRSGVRLVCLAGPSSSGKTTTSKRLMIQLQVLGKRPVTLELDNYYVDRDKTPRDENGNFDFEALEALNLPLVNEHLQALLAGEEVDVPRYDFVTGTSKPWKKMRLDPGEILIIEGIHGLNNRLTESIPRELKYSVFISPLTGVSIDRHNRIGTTDNRLLRRLVRDHRTRGYSPQSTLLLWPSVIRGSHRHIFPYEEGADALFNTSLAYEIPVLKPYAEPLLRAIPETSPAYGEAQRLIAMLNFVPAIPADNVPNLSIIREFIGGSCFE